MKGTLVVFRKEIYSIFASPIFYAASFIFFVVAGYFFYSNTLYFSILSFQATRDPFLSEKLNLTSMVVTPFFGDLSTILLLMLPLITMRLYSEERKTGTIELLFTYPLSDVGTLLGKYLATLLVLVIMVAGTLPYMGLLESFASLDWGVVFSGYLGVFLLGAGFIALGIFTSCLTENQIVAAVLSFGALLLFWGLVWARSYLGPVAGHAVELISIVTHLEPFTKGLVNTKDIVYYVVFVFFWLFMTVRFLKLRYWRG
ncbi:MAG: ABC transporter permease [Deltaproteobacteria bacterium]|nr:MAG: ABC transporter permease [Deltaproteobacteria bacterium]